MNPWLAFTAVMASLALIAGAIAWIRRAHERRITLAKWKRRAERTHQYYENMRAVTRAKT